MYKEVRELAQFYLETYGCALNKSDSDIIVGRLGKLGVSRTFDLQKADVVIINSCGVKEPTEDRIIHRIRELRKIGQPMIITGCLSKIAFDRVRRALDSGGAILGPQTIDSLGPIFFRVLEGEKNIVNLESDSSSKLRFFLGPPNSVICTIPICEGCLGNCAYCAVKFARSDVCSYSIAELYAITKQCVHQGYQEIRLTSQDAGAFGYDTGESLVDLLRRLDSISGQHRFRIGMFNPNLVIDNLLDILNVMKSNHFFKFFHVPLQSGSNHILELMNRRYCVEDWGKVIRTIREHFPSATIATDIIVGFPGESDDDFENTLRILKEFSPTLVNISKYGDRPGTIASQSQEKVDTLLKKNRSRQLSRFVSSLTRAENKSWIGWSGPAIVTECAPKGGYVCRNSSYKYIVVNKSLSLGDVIKVRIVDSHKTYLSAITIP
ncbi:MAG: tRNA (N(6)-L-threonylcarbamoyladenosine(37)-C(2))-methylthiotransferase [Candidatus Lokiarchaeota archaeon]|nr:tRNA (N(6)-L-threonylcarbamoyladenosine(37)-C(2))-methylthiotransferase [Candidatus Lokiarchaeota archaeon]